MIPEAAVEALARILAESALFDADCGGYGWNAETDSSDHFMPTARKKARRYLEAAAPHIAAQALRDAVDAFPLETITTPDNAVVWLMRRAEELGSSHDPRQHSNGL